MTPRHVGLYEKGLLQSRTRRLENLLRSCRLCPRGCGINRSGGEEGFCGLDAHAVVNAALPHHGEEPVISGTRGAGTIFFSSCNLRCVYCQNYQISHGIAGRRVDADELAGMMMRLQDQLCHNIEAVTAAPHLPVLMGALCRAVERGLRLPLVYNSGGYEDATIMEYLDGVVDVYLPDFKYGNDRDARALSDAGDYVSHALASIQAMVRQVGDGLETSDGVASQGIIIRHLVLPGMTENSREVLNLIKNKISLSVPLSIMSQYTPTPAVKNHPVLGRRVTQAEYDRVVNEALDMGFDCLFVQEVSEDALTPDFEKDQPFRWG